MNNFSRFYNDNKYLVWLIIIILILFIVIIQILNNVIEKENENEKIIGSQNTTNNNTSNTLNQNYSVITGNEVNNEISAIIKEFFDYCCNQEVEKAYALLSDDCKDLFYPRAQDFYDKYYSPVFNNRNITYSYQSWITSENRYTYKVDFIEDMLATGVASKGSITDYCTVVGSNDGYRLNINKLVAIEDINKSISSDNITVTVKRKRIYMDYETYELEIQNRTTQEILLDELQAARTVYVENENGDKYYWLNPEILEEDITIRRVQNKDVEIKFNKEYRQDNETTKIIFSRIMIDELNTIKIEVNL